MKRFKLLVLTFLLILSTLSPMTVHAEGNGNINNGEKERPQTSGIPEMKESESQWLVPVTEVQ